MSEVIKLDHDEFKNHDLNRLRTRLTNTGHDRSAAAVVREQANVEQFSDHVPVFTQNEFEPLQRLLEI